MIIAAVTGGRRHHVTIAERQLFIDALRQYQPTIVRCGGAEGVDQTAERIARAELGDEAVEVWLADWDRFRGRKPNPAGFIRSRAMLDGDARRPGVLGPHGRRLDEAAGILFAFRGGSGTAEALSIARQLHVNIVPIGWKMPRRPTPSQLELGGG